MHLSLNLLFGAAALVGAGALVRDMSQCPLPPRRQVVMVDSCPNTSPPSPPPLPVLNTGLVCGPPVPLGCPAPPQRKYVFVDTCPPPQDPPTPGSKTPPPLLYVLHNDTICDEFHPPRD